MAAAAESEPAGLKASHLGLIAMLAFVVMFEGFDISLTNVVLPFAGKAYGVDAEGLGRSLSVIGLGAIAAWFLIRLSDRFGRRPILMVSAAAFSVGSLVTILMPTIESYTIVQALTRIALVSQIATAYLIVSETLPAHMRGRANGLLGACGSFGAALPALFLRAALDTTLSWRALFLVGAAPLLILPLLWIFLKETPAFQANRTSGAPRMSVLAELRTLLAPGLRGRFATMSALWFIANFSAVVSTFFFTFYVLNERGWTALDLALISPFGLVSAFLGYLGVGFLMDLIGRRATAILFFIANGILVMTCYAATDWYVIAACFVAIQAMLGVWTVCFTINSELFPTHVRAAANGWCHNLVGRWGMVGAPLLIGWLSKQTGSIADTCFWLGLSCFTAVPLILFALPETRAANLATRESHL
ncbi:MFS transporter, putative metabolite:H+ symporter [Sphingomonas laterariae]|uniref:MFS transporter, putative metabolite:H+ symporter n=1 Tax=Edaphosphingomonas laterariae TaxID=861865 RepID=A0A239BCB4_9SPHN|nr:MFS transporter [Sphingomonas laterariae]SNS05068.1 MFS transporter, putative metabolite:H+ symporter [Sphingomonas laterariae]